MVVMPVGEDGEIGLFQVDAEPVGVVGEFSRLSGIEKDPPAGRLDIEAQSVLRGQAFIVRPVFDQYGYLHFGCRLFLSRIAI